MGSVLVLSNTSLCVCVCVLFPFQHVEGNAETHLFESNCNGGYAIPAQVPLGHVVESWETPEAGVTIKTEDAQDEEIKSLGM